MFATQSKPCHMVGFEHLARGGVFYKNGHVNNLGACIPVDDMELSEEDDEEDSIQYTTLSRARPNTRGRLDA